MTAKLKATIERIHDCKSIGELEFLESIFKKDFEDMEKVDFETECLKKFQELRG